MTKMKISGILSELTKWLGWVVIALQEITKAIG